MVTQKSDSFDPSFTVGATSTLVETGTRVLKAGDTFGLFDRFGNLNAKGLAEPGLYHHGTRFLSQLRLRFPNDRLLLLDSSIRDNNLLLSVDLMNPDMLGPTGQMIERGTLHVNRTIMVRDGVSYERVRITNYGHESVEVELVFDYASDFVDLFEVRGTRREQRGQLLEPRLERDWVALEYMGLDECLRTTRVSFDPAPTELHRNRAKFRLSLAAKELYELNVTAACGFDGVAPLPPPFARALAQTEATLDRYEAEDCSIHSSNEQFNVWVARSLADLRMMITERDFGRYPYAGVPWFSTPFGRDGIITALQSLWVTPQLAKGVLQYLAREQALHEDAESDAEPGKILHEAREGEMARLKEIPFGRYYGSVDSTPLFVMLAAEYLTTTHDVGTIRHLWPAIHRALEWIDNYGDRDGDGFVEYARQSDSGLVQQGWKDSHDSVFHQDGRDAEGPIALCEVQGYVYAAKLGASHIAAVLGDEEHSRQLKQQAEELRYRFDEAFWCEELGAYALALDGKKQRCRVLTSNAGHCLYTKIAFPERARVLADRLVSREMFSGWGVRTLSVNEARYNPMAYHNGSVWPHDNALVAAGFAHYGFKEHVLKVMGALFEASLFLELNRMPELLCGFLREPDDSPTLYPVACAPQAWAAAAVFQLIAASLGLTLRAEHRRVEFERPMLPEFVNELVLSGLSIGPARVDLRIQRHGDDVTTHVMSRDADVQVAIFK